MALKIKYLPCFVRLYRKLPVTLRAEVMEKIALFLEEPRHPFLKIHKLHGSWTDKWSFSVNYEYRVVFQYLSKDEVVMLVVGSHEVYK